MFNVVKLKFFFLVLIALVCASEANSKAEPVVLHAIHEDCSSWEDPVNKNQVNYCVISPEHDSSFHMSGHKTGKILYAFHGMGGSAKNLCDSFLSNIHEEESLRNISHIVCPSFGPHWAIHKNGRKDTFERFHALMMHHYPDAAAQKPVLYGLSMGGFNVLKLSGSNSRDTLQFEKVVSACPAIFSSKFYWMASFIALDGLFQPFDGPTARSLMRKSPFFDDGIQYPELFLFLNQDDSVGKFKGIPGIYRGAIDFFKKMQEEGQGGHVQMKVLPGGHCDGIPLGKVLEYLGN